LSESGDLLSLSQFQSKFNLQAVNFLDYECLLRVLKKTLTLGGSPETSPFKTHSSGILVERQEGEL
jgi:hypothetical protein